MTTYLRNIISELELEKTKFNNKIYALKEEFLQNNLIAPEFLYDADEMYKCRKLEGFPYQLFQNSKYMADENIKHIRMTRKCTKLIDKIEYLYIELQLLEDYEIQLSYDLDDNLNYPDEDEYEDEYNQSEKEIEIELDPEIIEVANIMVEIQNQEK